MRGQSGHAAAGQLGMDLGDAAVLGVPQGADQGDDVEAELVLREGIAALLLGAERDAVPGAEGCTAPGCLDSQFRVIPTPWTRQNRLRLGLPRPITPFEVFPLIKAALGNGFGGSLGEAFLDDRLGLAAPGLTSTPSTSSQGKP